jgi:uncharacterized protein (TIGR03067 family)
MNLVVALVLASFVVQVKQAQESFQGEWKMVEYIKEGFSKTEDELGDSKITVKGGKMTIRLAKADAEVLFTLDPTTDPTTIDLYLGEQNSQNLVMGIYKLEKDKLTICISFADKDRPKEFKSPKDSRIGMLVVERVKK